MITNIQKGIGAILEATERGEISWAEVTERGPDFEWPLASDIDRIFLGSFKDRRLSVWSATTIGEDPEYGYPVERRTFGLSLADVGNSTLAEGWLVKPLYDAAAAQVDDVKGFWESVLEKKPKKKK